MPSSPLHILFIVNPGSGGRKKTDWEPLIREYFGSLPHRIHIYKMEKNAEKAIRDLIKKEKPDRIVAVGGDGTVSLVGKILQGSQLPLAILPGGSANGMATELGIPSGTDEAMDVIINGKIQNCDAICVNDKQFCFHLSDVGLNARLIKYFDESNFRGMWNYARLLIKALINRSLMKINIKADGLEKQINAYMVVLANASKYGTGAVINPDGSISDGKFELVIVRKIALSEFIKLFWSYKSFNPKKVEIFQTTQVEMTSRRSVYFQVDGEYMGKIKHLHAAIIPAAIRIIVPADIESL